MHFGGVSVYTNADTASQQSLKSRGTPLKVAEKQKSNVQFAAE